MIRVQSRGAAVARDQSRGEAVARDQSRGTAVAGVRVDDDAVFVDELDPHLFAGDDEADEAPHLLDEGRLHVVVADELALRLPVVGVESRPARPRHHVLEPVRVAVLVDVLQVVVVAGQVDVDAVLLE